MESPKVEMFVIKLTNSLELSSRKYQLCGDGVRRRGAARDNCKGFHSKKGQKCSIFLIFYFLSSKNVSKTARQPPRGLTAQPFANRKNPEMVLCRQALGLPADFSSPFRRLLSKASLTLAISLRSYRYTRAAPSIPFRQSSTEP